MKRTRLVRDIQALDQRLSSQLAPFQQSGKESIQTLERLNPWWLIGSGLAAGLVAGRLGVRSAYTLGILGFKTQPLVHSVMNQWMGSSSE